MTDRLPLHPSRSTLRSVYGPGEPTLAATLLAILFAATGGLILVGAAIVVALAVVL
jgi:hypothetical protein